MGQRLLNGGVASSSTHPSNMRLACQTSLRPARSVDNSSPALSLLGMLYSRLPGTGRNSARFSRLLRELNPCRGDCGEHTNLSLDTSRFGMISTASAQLHPVAARAWQSSARLINQRSIDTRGEWHRRRIACLGAENRPTIARIHAVPPDRPSCPSWARPARSDARTIICQLRRSGGVKAAPSAIPAARPMAQKRRNRCACGQLNWWRNAAASSDPHPSACPTPATGKCHLRERRHD